MADIHYLALLRGINVGGNNIIKMADLKACFEALGLTDVATYIQSGNVIFKSGEKNRGTLTKKIEAGLTKRFGYDARLVIITHQQLKQTVEEAPSGFGNAPSECKYDVIFLKEPLTPDEAMKHVRTKEGVDTAHAGKDAIYFSRRISAGSSSELTKLIGTPVYQSMTIRNWNTTTKLLALMEKQ